MNTLRLLISLTLTRIVGSVWYFSYAVVRTLRNSSTVSPAASISFTSGSDTLPSGRTTTSEDRSLSFQTPTTSTSSGPMVYPGGGVGALAGAVGPVGVAGG